MPDLDDRSRSTAERLIEVLLGALPDAPRELKWGRLTFTCEGDWHHWICAISPTKKEMKLMIHKGALFADPHGVMEGNGWYTRAIPFPGARGDRRRCRGADSSGGYRPPNRDVAERPSLSRGPAVPVPAA